MYIHRKQHKDNITLRKTEISYNFLNTEHKGFCFPSNSREYALSHEELEIWAEGDKAWDDRAHSTVGVDWPELLAPRVKRK